MTNTLTWNFKPIQVPKLNTNWLSVISFIVLCTMTFVAINAFADCCEELEEKVFWAKVGYQIALNAAKIAIAAFEFVRDFGGKPEAVEAARALAVEAVDILEAATNYLIKCLKELEECWETPHEMASGSCNSGSCG